MRDSHRNRGPIATGARIGAACLVLASQAVAQVLFEDDSPPAILADTTRALTAADLDDFDAPRADGTTDDTPAPSGGGAVDRSTVEAGVRAIHQSPLPRKEKSAPPKTRRKSRTTKRKSANAPPPATLSAGCFQMGSREKEGASNERPRHFVCLDSFRLDRTPVSQREFEDSTGSAPWTSCAGPACQHPDPAAPAWFVTWTEAADFCRRRGGRLPTEAEYEYALRAGDSTLYPWGDSLEAACRYANLADASLGRALRGWKTFPCDDRDPFVGRSAARAPNRWGLWDMTGNVWEWTGDWYAPDAYSRSRERNPTGPDSGSGRVIRGGSWMTGPDGARAAYRDGFNPEGRYTGSIGFRCAYPAR